MVMKYDRRTWTVEEKRNRERDKFKAMEERSIFLRNDEKVTKFLLK